MADSIISNSLEGYVVIVSKDPTKRSPEGGIWTTVSVLCSSVPRSVAFNPTRTEEVVATLVAQGAEDQRAKIPKTHVLLHHP